MKTKIFKMENKNDDNLGVVAALLKSNEVVGFPTETVYGLGANALDASAVNKIFKAKGRPSDNPLIVHVSDLEMLNTLVEDISEKAEILMSKFWPGPLTLIFKSKGIVAENVTAGLKTLAIRFPDHEIARAIIEQAGMPIAAPSANNSGKPSPTCGEHVFEDLDGKISAIVYSDESKHGLESTILDMTKEPPILLRPGSITIEDIENVIGGIESDPNLNRSLSSDVKPLAPGMKYKHYSPKADVRIIQGESDKVVKVISDMIDTYKDSRVGVMCCDETKSFYQAEKVISLGSRNDLNQVASNLFNALRSFDHENVSVVLCEGYTTQGTGQAIMNRLNKAAGYEIINV